MKRMLVDLLVDPRTLMQLTLNTGETGDAEILTGSLETSSGDTYAIRAGIPRFTDIEDDKQVQTRDTFAFKWQKRDSYENPQFDAIYTTWLCDKYGFASLQDAASYFNGRQRILDLGCGSGGASLGWLRDANWTGSAVWVGVDISEAIDVAMSRVGGFPNTHFVQADALQLPFADGTFDTILSEGVLHHTPSTRSAILSASRVLASGGEFHFYVYRRKAPIREYTDDFVRDAIQTLSDEDAWNQMRSLTQLGRALAELNVQVEVPDVPLLGIKAGSYDVQRFIYWHFSKLFWNSDLPFENNVHINFDWYRPQYAHRQSEEEIRIWCAEANLRIERLHEQESGYTVKAIRE